MLRLKSALVSTLAGFTFIISLQAFAQSQTQTNTQTGQEKINITPPKPIENKVLDSMVGTWHAENNMLGTKTDNELEVRWGINHQYLIMHLLAKSVENSNLRYEGLGILGPSGKGHIKAWWFDSWGADAVNTGTGQIQGNRLVLNNTGEMFSENRTIEVQGDEMKMHAKGVISLVEGQKTDFDETVVYKKR